MQHCLDYLDHLKSVTDNFNWEPVEQLTQALNGCISNGNRVFLCGNGGSAANAMHIANDLLYGCASDGKGLKAIALTSNPAIVTCLANDLGYDDIFARQLAVQGDTGDILIAFSGSGNSENIIRALKQSKSMGIRSFAVLGYSGGQCKGLADTPIHFPINDMQIAEDLQLIVGHMVMQTLLQHADAASDIEDKA